MAAKLTLSVEESLIEQAKVLASKTGRSLSSIVSEFLQSLIDKDRQELSHPESPIVSKLAGIIDLPEDYDYKEDFGNHLIQKYG